MVASRRRLTAVFLCLVAFAAFPILASAATADFRVLIDNLPDVGCNEGGMPGVDTILTTRVVTTDTSAQETRIYRQVCTAGVFGPPVDLDLTVRPAGLSTPSGLVLLETRIPYSAVPGIGTRSIRFGFDATDGFFTQHTLTLPNGQPIMYPPNVGKRHSANTPGTRNFVLDGDGKDWVNIDPLVNGLASDGGNAIRMLKIYAAANTADDFIYFRFDSFIDNSGPFAQDDTFARKVGQGLAVNAPGVLGNDGDPNGKPLTATPVSSPSHGSVILNPDGSFTYTPDTPTSDTTDKFNYKANNGTKDSNVAEVTIKVSNKNSSAPIANDDAYSTPEDTPLNVAAPGVLANDVDADGPTLTATLLTNPTHGSVVLSSNGAFTYNPTHNFFGTDTFTYRVTDGTSNDDATVTITITSVNDAPVAANINRTTNEEVPVSVTLSATDTEGGSFTWQVGSPSNGVLSGSAPNLTYTPNPNFFGTDTFTYTAKDSSNKVSNTATVTITVNPVNDAPSFSCGPTVAADSTAGMASFPNWATAISAGPANESSQTLTFEVTANSNPGLFSVQPAVSSNGTLTFTPVANATGSASITIRLRDSGGTANGGVDVSGTCSFTINVDGSPTVTSTTPTNGATGVAGNANVVINFSEPVNASGASFDITCATSGAHTFSTSASPSATFTLDPAADFTQGETCTVTVFAAGVTDADANDPPNNMAANYVFSFTIDTAPSVSSTTPANGATNVGAATNVTVNFSEPVNASGASFTINCATSGAHTFSTSSSPSATFTLDPTVDFTQGETCTVTVLAAGVTDADANDPPDNMLANYVLSFTIDAAPSVTAVTPTNTSTGIATNTNLTVTFSEPVTITNSSVTISCANTGAHTVSVSGGPTTWTVDPTSDFGNGELCTATVLAAQVSDNDTNDPPDNMLANFVWSFTTDTPPSVTATTPVNASTSSPDTDVTVTFDEAVNATTSSFTISCTTSGAHTFALSGGPTTFTLNPTTDFTGGETCTVTVVAAQVTDTDAGDPPDNMAANYVFSFGVDAAPSVTSTTPANSATQVAANANVVVNFSESVNASGASFDITCATSGAHTFSTSASPSATFTLDPTADFTQGETCTVTVFAAGVTDVDAFDPPDNMAANYVFSFTVDQAPSVTSTTPPNGATDISAATNVTINFSESVNASGASFDITCASSGAHTFSTSSSPSATFTLNPTADFTAGETCTVTAFAAGITDADAFDPPDNMLANYVFSFTIDAAPSVTAVTPTDTSTGIATNTNLTVTFSEPVTITNSSVTISCANTGAHTVTVSGGPTTWTVDPASDFGNGELCTATVLAAQVSDNDTNDPPDNMLANFVWSFTTDTPPSVTATTPVNASTSSPDTDVTVTFDEAVNATASSFTISCTTSGAHTFALSGGPTTFTLNPTTDFTGGETCTVTVVAAQVTDTDAGDPPDNMAANYVFSFGVDAAPSVTSTTPTNGATQVAANANVVVNFSESVNASGASFDITCATSGAHTFSTSASPSATFTLDPTADFTQGETCTVTVFAAGVTDVDAFDPPDNMAANYVFSFTVDQAPSVTSTTPPNGATDISAATNVTINFSESVNASGASFDITCASSGAHTFSTSSSPSATFTLNPTADFTAGETCTVTAFAAGITDADAFDPPDNMLANYVFSFTIDAAPSVTAVTPTDTSTGIATNTNLSITFSEPVTITNSSVTISCANTGAHTVSVSGGPNTWTVDPTSDFGNGELCTATVLAAQVSDNDTNDPPDNMLANFVWSFTTDTPPSVSATTPTNASTTSPDTNVSVTFDEAVNASGSSFTISCNTSGAHTFALSGGPTTFTLDPTTDFTAGETCTVTVVAAQVTDQDAGDPPDNMVSDYVFTFSIDAAPTVLSTTPTNGSIDNPTNVAIVINYSEPVTAGGTAYTITCPSTRAFTLGGNGTATHTLTPTINLPPGATCTVSILAAQITDTDTNDPPDNMAANYSFSFSLDQAPFITATSPNDGATGIATNTNIQITWNESVTLSSAGISCATSGSHTSVITGNPGSVSTINPDTDFVPNELCTVTILNTAVSDTDTNDPPDNMGPTYSFQFTTDAAPSVTAVTPTDTSTGIATNTNLSITFSEAVTITNSSVTISCANTGAHTVAVSGGPTVWTVDPNSDFGNGELCTATVLAAQVSDNDAGDPPDNMAANFVWSFTTDTPPSVTATTPTNASVSIPATNITVTFDEPVNAGGSSFTISCTSSGTHSYNLSGGPTTWTLNPDSDFTEGETCTVTVVAAQVTDTDAGDPPDNMVSDYVFTFSIDSAPTVQSTSPTNGATNLATNVNIVITYSEPVNAGGTAYTLSCTPSNTSRPFVLSGNGTAVHTIDPNTNLPAGQTCTVAILASQITDVDSNDPPDNMAANYNFSFTTDANPQIVSTSPVDGSTVATNTNVGITWTEPVNMTTVNINCTVSGSHTSVLSTSDNITWTVNPNTDFTPGEVCTILVLSASVTDVDANDPPDNPGPDISWQYTVDTAPTVTSTTPTDLATQQANNANITINFSESVAATTSSFTISCATSGSHTYTLSSSPSTSFTLDPNTDFTNGEQCTVTVVAAQIADNDAFDPPDNMAANYVFTFTVDTPPTVSSTTPTEGASTVTPTSTITINFSESVNATTSSFTINCGGNQPYTLSASPSASFTLTPTSNLPATACTVTVIAAQITDADAGDPPDNMVSNFTLNFTVNTPPTANDDVENALGNLTMTVLDANGVLANDTDPDSGASLTVQNLGPFTGSAGGTILFTPGGGYTYHSEAGDQNVDDVFTYTVKDNNNATDTGQLTIHVGPRYLFVDANFAGAPNDGRDTNPFKTLQQAEAGSAANDTFVIKQGSYTDFITLKAGQVMYGDGASAPLTTTFNSKNFTVLTPSGTPPALRRNTAGTTLTLATNNTLRGIDVAASSGTAIAGTAFGTLTVSETVIGVGTVNNGTALDLNNGVIAGAGFGSVSSITPATFGMRLQALTGTLTIAGGTITNAPNGTLISGGSGGISYGGNISHNNGTNRIVEVTGRTGGTVTFSGTMNSTGRGLFIDNNSGGTINISGSSLTFNTGINLGVELTTNTGATINFPNGNLNITTTTGQGFSAFTGGTLSIGGTNNSISVGAATGNALIMNGITLSGTATFATVSANGSQGGISLTSIGNGNVTVNGGTIQNTTNQGIQLVTLGTSTVTLANVTVSGTNPVGITGTTFGSLVVNNTVNVTGVSALSLNTGTVTGTFGTMASTGGTNGVSLASVQGTWGTTSGTLTGATGTTFVLSGSPASAANITWGGNITQANAALVADISGNANLTVNGNVTSSGTSTGISVGGSGTINFAGTNAFTGAGGITIAASASGNFTFGTNTTNTTAGTSFNVAGGGGAVTAVILYRGTINKATGGAMVIVDNLDTPGTLNMTRTSQATGDLTLNNNGSLGITVQNSSSTNITISNASITFNNAGAGFTASGNTGGTINLNGLVLAGGGNKAGMLISGGGTINVAAGVANPSINMTGGSASAIDGTTSSFTGTLNLTNATITGNGATAVNLTGSTLGGTGSSITNAGIALNLSGVALTNGAGMTSITSSAGTNGISMVNCTGGTYTVTGGSLTNNTTAAFALNNSAANAVTFSYGGSISPAINARAIDIGTAVASSGMRGGTLTFSGNLTTTSNAANVNAGGVRVRNSTAGTLDLTGGTKSFSSNANNAVDLTTNPGATFNFSSATSMTITSTSGAAFTSTAGGTVNVTGATNTISTSTGTAVNIATPSNIGASGATFKSITVNNGASNSATNAIILNGTTNAFTVTGDGTQTSGLYNRNGSGGTLNRTTGHSVLLTNADNVTLRQMVISNTASGGSCPASCTANAVSSSGGSNILLQAMDLTTLGGHGWYAVNPAGVSAFNNNSRVFTWNTANASGVYVDENVSFTSFTVDNTLFSTSATGADGFLFDGNAGSGTVNVTSSEFTLIDQDGVQVNNDGSGTITAVVSKCNFHDADNTSGDGNNTLFLSNSGSGTLNFTVGGALVSDGNTFNNLGRLITLAGVVQVNAVTTSKTGTRLNGTIQNNTISNSTGRRGIDFGIEAGGNSHGRHDIVVSNNNISNMDKQGISFLVNSVSGGSVNDTHITVLNNTMTNVGTEGAVDSGSAVEFETNYDNFSSGGDITNYVLFQGNSATNSNTSSGVGATFDITNRGGDAGTNCVMNMTLHGNSFTNSAGAPGRVMIIRNSGGGTGAGGTFNLNINGDNTSANNTTLGGSTAGDIGLTQSLGTFNVQGGTASVSPNNNGDTVTLTGSFNTIAGPVTLP